MGYNSFGNIAFFGIGVLHRRHRPDRPLPDVAAYTGAGGGDDQPAPGQYFIGLLVGLAAAPLLAVAVAVVLGSPCSACAATTSPSPRSGLGIAAGELAAGWDLHRRLLRSCRCRSIPAASASGELLFYFLSAGLGVAAFLTLRWLYAHALRPRPERHPRRRGQGGGAGPAHHALQDRRLVHRAPCSSASPAASSANIIGFIDPREVAFAGATFGVWMVLMAILGGKGTLWGPVIGAAIFHVTRELFWTYLFGWQNVAHGRAHRRASSSSSRSASWAGCAALARARGPTRATANERAARGPRGQQALSAASSPTTRCQPRRRQRAQIVGLIGPNGSGKTTLFNSHRRHPSDRRRLDPLRRPRDLAPARARDRAPRPAPHLSSRRASSAR